ncbi:hypothetical protein BOO91_17400 [Vibrio navarrensis]|nr:hypothetical protein UF06_12575 [Vibrio sp. S234-5]MBE3662710.1 hypothetical protein [Vibrio navarrensis]
MPNEYNNKVPSTEYHKLPLVIQVLIYFIGYDEMYTLINEHGGQNIYIPKNPSRGKVSNLLSPHSLNVLSEHFGGTYLMLPTLLSVDIQRG